MGSLEVITGSPWAPVLIALTIAGSAVFPPLPSETMLVTATGLAVAGELSLVLVLIATTTGALLGDLTAYTLGRLLSHQVRHRTTRSGRGQSALRWLDEHGASWGPGLIIGARFIPGGTTAVGISAGILTYPLPRLLLAAIVGALAWTGYGLVLAVLGRTALPGSTWAGVLLALAIALVIGALVRAVRIRRHTTSPRTPRRRHR